MAVCTNSFKTAQSLKLAEIFYVALGESLPFGIFAMQCLACDEDIRFIGKLLFTQPFNKTEKFTDKFYSWCKQNDKMELAVPKIALSATKNKIAPQKPVEGVDFEVITLTPKKKLRGIKFEGFDKELELLNQIKLEVPGGITLLHVAAMQGDVKKIICLIQEGADIYAQDQLGRTAYDLAIYAGRVDAAWCLLLADRTFRAIEGTSRFEVFAERYLATDENIDCVCKFLLRAEPSKKMELFFQKVYMWSLKNQAFRCPSVPVSLVSNSDPFLDSDFFDEPIVEKGGFKLAEQKEVQQVSGLNPVSENAIAVILNVEPNERKKMMKDAEFKKQYEYKKINELKICKYNLLEKMSTHATALHISAQEGFPLISQYLIKRGVKIDDVDDVGNTALHRAVEHNHLDVVKIFVNNGANYIIENCDQEMALLIAAKKGFLPILKFLAEQEQQDYDGSSALHILAKQNNSAAIEYLVQNVGFDVNKVNSKRQTALHCAAQNGRVENVIRLIKLNADLDKGDFYGNTPLHCAVEGGKKEVVHLLVQNGANIELKNFEGKTAKELALELKLEQTSFGNASFASIKDYLDLASDLHMVRENSAWAAMCKGSPDITKKLIVLPGFFIPSYEKQVLFPALILFKRRKRAYEIQETLNLVRTRRSGHNLWDFKIYFKKDKWN